ncbi:MAG: aspartate--tRNA(Asn) ligase [Halobaculum sp.]
MTRTFIADVAAGTETTISGWIETIRDQGSIAFVIVRDKSGSMQVVVKDEQLLEEITSLTQESVVSFTGHAEAVEQAPGGIELKPDSVEVIAEAETPLPFQPTDGAPAGLDTRLDNRFIDLRDPEIRAKFSVAAQVADTFADHLEGRSFEEIYPPGIIGSASEGGSELFSLPYFEKTAYLAQSPQLYKQMCVVGGMERVYDVSRIWRAEKSNTPKHLTEAIQLDMEMGFADADDVIDVAFDFLQQVERDVNELCGDELETLDVEVELGEPQRVTYTEAIELLQEEGHDIEWGEDLGTPAERKLSEVVGWDSPIAVTAWPDEMKEFYVMPRDDELSEGFDLLFRGLELASGGQRVHLPELLEERIAEQGLDPRDFEGYIRTFRYGSPPHAGWAIGFERLVMKLLGQDNIREVTLFPRDPDRITP